MCLLVNIYLLAHFQWPCPLLFYALKRNNLYGTAIFQVSSIYGGLPRPPTPLGPTSPPGSPGVPTAISEVFSICGGPPGISRPARNK